MRLNTETTLGNPVLRIFFTKVSVVEHLYLARLHIICVIMVFFNEF